MNFGYPKIKYTLLANSLVYGTLDGLQPIDTLSKAQKSDGAFKKKWPYATYCWLQSPTTDNCPPKSLLHKHVLQQLIPID